MYLYVLKRGGLEALTCSFAGPITHSLAGPKKVTIDIRAALEFVTPRCSQLLNLPLLIIYNTKPQKVSAIIK